MQTPAHGVVMAPVSPAVGKLLHKLTAAIINERDQAVPVAGAVVLAAPNRGTLTSRATTVNGEHALFIDDNVGYRWTLYRNHTPRASGDLENWHPAHWWGSERRVDADGIDWIRVLPHHITDDFGYLVPVGRRA
jgi:hypothetical protein